MLVVKHPAYFNDDRIYHNRQETVKLYDEAVYPQNNNMQNYDLRLIIVRHAERIDVDLGENWYDQIFGGVSSASPQNYRHPLLPSRLPHRSNTLLYVFDPPITRIGEQKSFYKGQQLSRAGASVDYCYSSPACRSVITANAILHGMNRSNVPIRLETYLFEPLAWNKPFQELNMIPPFMSTGEWKKAGYNVDRRYQSINRAINLYETEEDFWLRSKEFFDKIQQRHGHTTRKFGFGRGSNRRSNILIVGHAASPLIFPSIAFEEPFDPYLFGQQCGQIPYLHTVVLERNAKTHIWKARPIKSFA
ncbi:unnamed protein product [Rotaria sp. Silwood2]|nr:unnamed protein product [Rotaria sp. Silwood2]CAF2579919.1 unnamed protein product [Rotaria sp. Silwood2]CAF2854341.1 unnamed protein product [Rotaria sp. Silwood2]CAF2987863.1 unnamed protein product [Rotaria sp. Silwood2]CAF4041120.1 unnamed protein product [Rotaria sp. Silwood2]